MEWITERLFGPALSIQRIVGKRTRAPLRCVTASEAIEELSRMLASDALVTPSELAGALMEREMISPTVVEGGVAVPRARLPGVPRVVGALAVAPDGIPFHVRGSVRIFLALVAPVNDQESYLRALACVTLALHDVRLRRALLSARSDADVRDVLTFWRPARAGRGS